MVNAHFENVWYISRFAEVAPDRSMAIPMMTR
jgi:hypothetical protein